MMGSLELGPEADVSQLEPLLTPENIEQLEATFVTQIQVSSWGPGTQNLWHQLGTCICRVACLLVSSSISALLQQYPAALCPFPQGNVAQWLQKALDGEVAEWNREQEPGTDSSGFYHSPMPAIVLQVGRKRRGRWEAPIAKGENSRTRTDADGHPFLPLDPGREHSGDQHGQ